MPGPVVTCAPALPRSFACALTLTLALAHRELRYHPTEAGIAQFTGVLTEQREVVYNSCSNPTVRTVLKRALRISPAARCTADSLLSEVCELEGEPRPYLAYELTVSLGRAQACAGVRVRAGGGAGVGVTHPPLTTHHVM